MRIDELSKAIENSLKEYKGNVDLVVKASAARTARKTAKSLRATSPKRTGKYAQSWTSTVVKQGIMGDKAVVYAKKPRYRLTHLLEKGHAKRNGGRVAPKVHIAPAEQEAIRIFEEEIIKGLKQWKKLKRY